MLLVVVLVKNLYSVMEDKLTTTDNCTFCNKCVNRIFNKDICLHLPKGNISSRKLVILPFVEFDSTTYEDKELILSEAYVGITGMDIKNDMCITRNIRCKNVPTYNTYMSACRKCNQITFRLINDFNIDHVFIFGNVWQTMFNFAPIRHFKSGNVNYYYNYSPGVAYYDADKFNTFKTQLAEDIQKSNIY